MTFNVPVPSVRVLGVRVDDYPLPVLLEEIGQIIASGSRAIVANVNIHALNIGVENAWFRRFLNDSKIVFCDGYGVIVGARLAGKRLRYRHTYADSIHDLCRLAARQGYSVFFLGGRPGIALRAAERLLAEFPTLKIAGVEHGYFNKARDHADNRRIVARINRAHADMLMLGLGMPLQEQWLLENWGQLNTRTAFTGGAVFDYVSGTVPRAPRWMTNYGLEWLGRLLIEPGRLWKRYLLGNPLCLWRIVKHDLLGLRLPDNQRSS